jgi:hypothetical protein
MRRSFLLNIFVLTISCHDKGDKSILHDKVDKLQETIEAPPDKSEYGPTINFRVIVRVLDSLGYKSDTARVAKFKNYKELLYSEVAFFGNFLLFIV